MNTYWEANMPQSYPKPMTNASNPQVSQFLTDKYVNKKWVNSKMKHEPVWLYANRKSKYDRFVKKTMKALKGEISEEEDNNDSESEQVKKVVKQDKQKATAIKQPFKPQAKQQVTQKSSV